jgi:pimeloyl-ACP methyl ester carboxylesterase
MRKRQENIVVHAQEPSLTKVVSRDGTEIGFFTTGEGSPLLLIHGSLGDHQRWDALRPYLEPHFSVHAMDRRGRGASGDASSYSIEREYEDVAAVIDAIAASAGETVRVYCSSFGGLCLFGGYPLTKHIGRIALYEAWPAIEPAELSVSPDILDRADALLAEGRREAALELAYREELELSDEELEMVRSQPSWPARVAAAHTIPREARAFAQVSFDASQASKIDAPTLLLIGSESPVWGPQASQVAAALPDARVAVIEGQGHVADLFAPERVAQHLLGFMLNR